jgi:hypothetical protein
MYKQHSRNGITYEKCHKWIDVDFRKNQKQISSNLDYNDEEIRDRKFDCRLKVEKRTILHSNRPGPAPSLVTGGCQSSYHLRIRTF